MVEFEVDMDYLEKYGGLNCVILHDENGGMDDVKFVPLRTCKLIKVHDWNDEWEPFGYECESCGEALPRCYGSDKFGTVITPNYCPNCGAKIVKTSENTNI